MRRQTAPATFSVPDNKQQNKLRADVQKNLKSAARPATEKTICTNFFCWAHIEPSVTRLDRREIVFLVQLMEKFTSGAILTEGVCFQ